MSTLTYSQNFVEISIKKTKEEMFQDTTLVSIAKECHVDLSKYTVLSLSKIIDTINFYETHKYNCRIVKQEIYFTKKDDVSFRFYEKTNNETSKKRINEKFIFCYISKQKNSNNKYEMFLYRIE